MKLCFIANGKSIHTQRWVQPLIDRGDQVVVISYTPTDRAMRGSRTVDLTRITNIRRIRFLVWGVWARRFVHEYYPAILHAHQIQAAGWLGYLASYHPFVVSAWGSDLLLEPHKSKLRLQMFSLVLNRCDRLIVPSPMMARRALDLGLSANKMCMIPWGIETDIFTSVPTDRSTTRSMLGIAQDRQVIFCPRGIQPLYQIHIVLEAIENIRQTHPDILCILLKYNVNDQYLNQLGNMIKSYQLEDYVRWLPAQNSREDMARLYRTSDVVVSVPTSEGYGFSVYEAMASGCPTVITDLSTFHGELENGVNTLTVPIGDRYATSQAIIRLLEDRALKGSLINNGIDLVHEKSLKQQVNSATELYVDLAKQV